MTTVKGVGRIIVIFGLIVTIIAIIGYYGQKASTNMMNENCEDICNRADFDFWKYEKGGMERNMSMKPWKCWCVGDEGTPIALVTGFDCP